MSLSVPVQTLASKARKPGAGAHVSSFGCPLLKYSPMRSPVA
jgi:hypothetical protein